MAQMIEQHTYGTHIYAKMRMDNGDTEEIDVYFHNSGQTYKTTKDNDTEKRQQIIDTFNELY